MSALGNDVATWRKLQRLTQAQVADRAGIHTETLRRLEGGTGSTSVEALLRVLRVLGVLEPVMQALDPYEQDIGRLRADEQLPMRVHPRRLTDG